MSDMDGHEHSSHIMKIKDVSMKCNFSKVIQLSISVTRRTSQGGGGTSGLFSVNLGLFLSSEEIDDIRHHSGDLLVYSFAVETVNIL